MCTFSLASINSLHHLVAVHLHAAAGNMKTRPFLKSDHPRDLPLVSCISTCHRARRWWVGFRSSNWPLRLAWPGQSAPVKHVSTGRRRVLLSARGDECLEAAFPSSIVSARRKARAVGPDGACFATSVLLQFSNKLTGDKRKARFDGSPGCITQFNG